VNKGETTISKRCLGYCNIVQELGGWKTASMVKRYATLTVKHLAPTAALFDRAMPTDLLLLVA
jgi:hypothetical protein